MSVPHQQQPFNLPPPITKQPPAPSLSAGGSAGAWWPRSRRRPRALQVQSRPADVIGTKTMVRDTKFPRAGKFFEMEMTVRGCELDKYGAVSSAVYAGYMETARQEMLASLGVCTGSIARAGRALALSKLTVKYMAPLKLVSEAMATAVCLNKDYRPTRMFPEMENLLHFFSA
ncbi:hypothetical protein BAE44_0021240 [Dichanthelium oligosanthes]|uniref:Uncharacterized protein n=1 Tax=Dichanthelium oligosanthes TaxID=888268 RepID=A0A1E5UXY6_9POAL|nr:hypothetical protein BAE44_0021240 [Dichanthelium oligosanthes]